MIGAGTLVTPTVRLVSQLGAGGMGSVWIADHLSLHTQVVVKFMHPELAADREASIRFSREAAAAANVKSPHVVQVHDHGVTAQGVPFIVMELLEGETLATHLAMHGALALPTAATVVMQTCKALARAHQKGFVHRDIKPDNIFLCHVGEADVFVKILDFGIAKASQMIPSPSATRTGSLMGTPFYMSPEQTVGAKTTDHRTDLWALGVVAFECVTGRRPFDAETVGGLAVAICNGPIPMPTQLNPNLPREIDAWFARACARDPSQRFASAREMADAFQAIAVRFVGTGQSDPRVSLPSLPEQREIILASTTHAPTSHVAGLPHRSSVPFVIGLGVLAIGGGLAAFGVWKTWGKGHDAAAPSPSASVAAAVSQPTAAPVDSIPALTPLVASSQAVRSTASPPAKLGSPTPSPVRSAPPKRNRDSID